MNKNMNNVSRLRDDTESLRLGFDKNVTVMLEWLDTSGKLIKKDSTLMPVSAIYIKNDIIQNAVNHMDIVDYTYTPVYKYDDKGNKTTYMKTTLTFRDNTETSVLCPVDKADKYYGFYACYAKHIAGGNKINDEAEYWIETLPKKLGKERLAEEKALAEEKKIEERNKKRREKKRVRMEAIRRKEAYDAAKLANEKYGIPMEFTYKNEDK